MPAAPALHTRRRREKKSGQKISRIVRREAHGGSGPLKTLIPPELIKKMSGPGGTDGIFNGSTVRITLGQIISDPFEALVTYVVSHHWREFEDARDRCPYYANFENPVMVFTQKMAWFVYERICPATGATVTEEFVNEYDVPEELAGTLLPATNLLHGPFKPVEKKGGDLVMSGMKTRKKHVAVTKHSSTYLVRCLIVRCIHPYGRQYAFCGITTAPMPP